MNPLDQLTTALNFNALVSLAAAALACIYLSLSMFAAVFAGAIINRHGFRVAFGIAGGAFTGLFIVFAFWLFFFTPH